MTLQKINLNLKNCYGIKSLKKTLDFTKKRAYAIYAPNGVMKSSLASTFKDAADDKETKDRIFPKRKTVREITDESGAAVGGESVLVVLPYDEEFGPNEKTSTLLVNASLRKELDEILRKIDEAKEALLVAIKRQAATKQDIEEELARAFTSDDDFDIAMERIQREIERQRDAPFASVEYDKIFNDKVIDALQDSDVRSTIEDYVRRYNELLTASTYFKKGTFDYYNAGQIADSLAKNGFFDADHTVRLNAGGGSREIKNKKDLEEVIAQEKSAIISDPALRKKFDAVQKKLEKNIDLRVFCKYMQDNEPLLARLNNVNKFKEDVLKSYIKANEDIYLELIKQYDAASARRKEIYEQARKESTQWEEVIAIFNDRFHVPFKLEAKNRTQLITGEDAIIELAFTYSDGDDSAEVEKTDLLKALSTGEKKALYILNVIFEIQTRKKASTESLVVVDDIADSFDYQNKYAIIQYLKDISEDGLSKLIIMTHNFDFFRTIESRFVGYSNCLIASKGKDGVDLVQAAGIRNIFANDWKGHFFDDDRKKIASICFLRNLIEMTTGPGDPDYGLLTSMVHWKSDTASITVKQLDKIFNDLCKTKQSSGKDDKLVVDLISEQANACLTAAGGLNLENKIVLAMGSRIAAERFLIAKINDQPFVDSIKENQTAVLIDKYKTLFPAEKRVISTLDRISVMTPENIHVNSFMYEPIVDMSDDLLRKLYSDVVKLS